MDAQFIIADYSDPGHAADILFLLDHYARTDAGGGQPLSNKVRTHLLPELSRRPHASSYLLYKDGHPAALANCFEGFSTFACAPLLNVHDLVVHENYRRQGLATALLNGIADHVAKAGFCKITLEVLRNNTQAMALYHKVGFRPYELKPGLGAAEFWQKIL